MLTAPFTTTEPREFAVLSCRDSFLDAPLTMAIVMAPEPDFTIPFWLRLTVPRVILLFVVATVPARFTVEAVAISPLVKVLTSVVLSPKVTTPVFKKVVRAPEIKLFDPIRLTA